MLLEDLDNKMYSSVEHFEKELQTIRTSYGADSKLIDVRREQLSRLRY